jgi:hypothetical protein
MLAAALVAVQGLVLLGYAVAEAWALSGSRVAMGVTTAAFFAVYGGGLLWCARALFRLRSWARSPVVLAQLIWLGVAWSFRGGATAWVTALLVVTAGVVLVGVLHPRSTTALAPD